MDDKQTEQEHQQYLIDTVLGWLGDHYDSSRLYEMLHDEMELSHADIEELGFDLSNCYRPEEVQHEALESAVQAIRDFICFEQETSFIWPWNASADEMLQDTQTLREIGAALHPDPEAGYDTDEIYHALDEAYGVNFILEGTDSCTGIYLNFLVDRYWPDQRIYLTHESIDIGRVPANGLPHLTDAGKTQFAKLLAAEVAVIHPGLDETEIVLRGVEPEELTRYDQALTSAVPGLWTSKEVSSLTVLTPERTAELLDNALASANELFEGEDRYVMLHDSFGLTEDEMAALGFSDCLKYGNQVNPQQMM